MRVWRLPPLETICGSDSGSHSRTVRKMDTDEFEITATEHPHMETRVWTRSKYDTAKFIADSAITKLGYGKAVVINTFGGHRSDTLYEVSGSHSRDFVAEERNASHQA